MAGFTTNERIVSNFDRMSKQIIALGKSVVTGMASTLAGVVLILGSMYVYVHYISAEFRQATALGMTWDVIAVLQQWGLSSGAIQIFGIGVPTALFLAGFAFGLRHFRSRCKTADSNRLSVL